MLAERATPVAHSGEEPLGGIEEVLCDRVGRLRGCRRGRQGGRPGERAIAPRRARAGRTRYAYAHDAISTCAGVPGHRASVGASGSERPR